MAQHTQPVSKKHNTKHHHHHNHHHHAPQQQQIVQQEQLQIAIDSQLQNNNDTNNNQNESPDNMNVAPVSNGTQQVPSQTYIQQLPASQHSSQPPSRPLSAASAHSIFTPSQGTGSIFLPDTNIQSPAPPYPGQTFSSSVYVHNVTANVSLHGWSQGSQSFITSAGPHYIQGDIPTDQTGQILQPMGVTIPIAAPIGAPGNGHAIAHQHPLPPPLLTANRGNRRGRGGRGGGIVHPRRDYVNIRHPVPTGSPGPDQLILEPHIMQSAPHNYAQPQFTQSPPYPYSFPTTYYPPPGSGMNTVPSTAPIPTGTPFYVPLSIYNGAPHMYNYGYMYPQMVNTHEFPYYPPDDQQQQQGEHERQTQDGTVVPQIWHHPASQPPPHTHPLTHANQTHQTAHMYPEEYVPTDPPTLISPGYMYDGPLNEFNQMNVVPIYNDPQMGHIATGPQQQTQQAQPQSHHQSPHGLIHTDPHQHLGGQQTTQATGVAQPPPTRHATFQPGQPQTSTPSFMHASAPAFVPAQQQQQHQQNLANSEDENTVNNNVVQANASDSGSGSLLRFRNAENIREFHPHQPYQMPEHLEVKSASTNVHESDLDGDSPMKNPDEKVHRTLAEQLQYQKQKSLKLAEQTDREAEPQTQAIHSLEPTAMDECVELQSTNVLDPQMSAVAADQWQSQSVSEISTEPTNITVVENTVNLMKPEILPPQNQAEPMPEKDQVIEKQVDGNLNAPILQTPTPSVNSTHANTRAKAPIADPGIVPTVGVVGPPTNGKELVNQKQDGAKKSSMSTLQAKSGVAVTPSIDNKSMPQKSASSHFHKQQKNAHVPSGPAAATVPATASGGGVSGGGSHATGQTHAATEQRKPPAQRRKGSATTSSIGPTGASPSKTTFSNAVPTKLISSPKGSVPSTSPATNPSGNANGLAAGTPGGGPSPTTSPSAGGHREHAKLNVEQRNSLSGGSVSGSGSGSVIGIDGVAATLSNEHIKNGNATAPAVHIANATIETNNSNNNNNNNQINNNSSSSSPSPTTATAQFIGRIADAHTTNGQCAVSPSSSSVTGSVAPMLIITTQQQQLNQQQSAMSMSSSITSSASSALSKSPPTLSNSVGTATVNIETRSLSYSAKVIGSSGGGKTASDAQDKMKNLEMETAKLSIGPNSGSNATTRTAGMTVLTKSNNSGTSLMPSVAAASTASKQFPTTLINSNELIPEGGDAAANTGTSATVVAGNNTTWASLFMDPKDSAGTPTSSPSHVSISQMSTNNSVHPHARKSAGKQAGAHSDAPTAMLLSKPHKTIATTPGVLSYSAASAKGLHDQQVAAANAATAAAGKSVKTDGTALTANSGHTLQGPSGVGAAVANNNNSHNDADNRNGNGNGNSNDEWSIKLAEHLSKYKVDLIAVHLRPRGLTNRSNYCYINSILQALFGCPPFYNLLRAIPKQAASLCSAKIPTINAMISFMSTYSILPFGTRLRLGKGPKGKDELSNDLQCDMAIEPTEIYKLWNDSRDSHVEGHQEDAEEFLGFVLNRLNDEMLELMKIIEKPATVVNGQDQPDEDGNAWQICSSRNKGSVIRQTDFGNTPLSDIFRGELRSRLQREGEHSTDDIQPFFTLPLNIEKAASVKEALEILVGRDQLEGVTGSKSKQEVYAWQQMNLEKLPIVLILHLKWFDYRSDACKKIIKKVDFPVELKIDSKILASKKYSNKQRAYRLFSIVYHDGKEATNGHYITDVYHVGYNCWLRYDDSSVRPVSEAHVLLPRTPRVPYLLLYRRSDTLPPMPPPNPSGNTNSKLPSTKKKSGKQMKVE